jgi:hypothetical protein
MSEINGLRNLISSANVPSGMSLPPVRDDFHDDESYDAAYEAWWVQTHCWKATRIES